ncbi:TRAP transporter small permease [Abyssalbus ytuae]|uniref:TRAP transporter small permease n=1 Tax=Abyssalbus ytuae TaxID=2926907 RepID=UPI0034E1AE2D
MKIKVDKFLEWALAVLLAFMVLDVLWGVFTRYVAGNQSSWTDELARFLLIWVGVLGAAYASGKNIHIAIDILPNYLNKKNQKKLQYFIDSIIILFVLSVFVIGGLRYVYISLSLGQTSPALRLPMGVVYLIFPLSGILIVYYKINHFFQNK